MMRIPNPEERPLLSIQEAGVFLGLGRTAAYAMVRRGDLPFVVIGGKKKIATAELRHLLRLDVLHRTEVTEESTSSTSEELRIAAFDKRIASIE